MKHQITGGTYTPYFSLQTKNHLEKPLNTQRILLSSHRLEPIFVLLSLLKLLTSHGEKQHIDYDKVRHLSNIKATLSIRHLFPKILPKTKRTHSPSPPSRPQVRIETHLSPT